MTSSQFLRRIKYFEAGKTGADFRLSKKLISSVRSANCKSITFNFDFVMTS